ncbi:hypothetical protein DFH94DRAFT_708361 [Russula ochroleuca]|uniref:Uncharacterized protein n=1 Tax=Russula ochroleuca TaxID=152965 RepID=A0A9P5N4E8_9AGAM|nr:hypothetical protein DFH94DRAFT_708361 [Russula ochroleuca]
MIQEAENMDKGLKAVLQRTQAHMTPGGVPFAPPQPPSAITDALVSPPVHPTAPPAPEAVSRPPHPPPLQPAHRKKPSRSQATPTLPPIPFVTPQAASPGITAPSPQTPKSPKGKPKPKPPTRHKGSKSANGPGVETPTAVHTVTPTPTSSTPVDAKGGRKRVRDDGNDAPTPGASSAPSPKRVKTKLGGPPNEET